MFSLPSLIIIDEQVINQNLVDNILPKNLLGFVKNVVNKSNYTLFKGGKSSHNKVYF